MNGHIGGRLTVASLNTLGLPLTGADLGARCRAIAEGFEESSVDVVNFQEVFTYRHLAKLTRYMPSFRHVGFRSSLIGPAAGLATLSRVPVAGMRYRRFPFPSARADLPRFTRVKAATRGCLVTYLARPRLRIVNTHPWANTDDDWSPGNRFHGLQREQLAVIARVVRETAVPTVVCGDFNVSRGSGLYRDFIAASGLADAFGGRCPPTYRAEFLRPGQVPFCIDFILATGAFEVESADVLFTGTPVSDHIGLRATFILDG